MADFNYRMSVNFRPFTMDEMLKPVMMYKEAYEKAEDNYTQLATDAQKWEDLPEGTEARSIYDNYMNDLREQATNLSQHGLNMNNRRTLTSLKRRYSGEIGRLERAQKSLDTEMNIRMELNHKDPTMLYADDNLSIDKYLNGKKPNTYNVSGNALYTRGAQAGQSASSKIYSDPTVSNITKYYQNFAQTNGISPGLLESFRDDMQKIPTFMKAVKGIAQEYGIDENLTGVNKTRAYQSIINGIIDGAVYKRTDNVKQNPGVLTASEEATIAQQKEARNLEAAIAGMVKDDKGNYVYGGLDNDPSYLKQKQLLEKKDELNKENTKKGKTTTDKNNKLRYSMSFTFDKDEGSLTNTSVIDTSNLNRLEGLGHPVTYEKLPEHMHKEELPVVVREHPENYTLLVSDDEKMLYIFVNDVSAAQTDNEEDNAGEGGGIH